jgi:hypothetical protein
MQTLSAVDSAERAGEVAAAIPWSSSAKDAQRLAAEAAVCARVCVLCLTGKPDCAVWSVQPIPVGSLTTIHVEGGVTEVLELGNTEHLGPGLPTPST